jgi:hypothetical protein
VTHIGLASILFAPQLRISPKSTSPLVKPSRLPQWVISNRLHPPPQLGLDPLPHQSRDRPPLRLGQDGLPAAPGVTLGAVGVLGRHAIERSRGWVTGKRSPGCRRIRRQTPLSTSSRQRYPLAPPANIIP